MTSKHPKSKHPSDADLKYDPGIGRSKGVNRLDPLLDGENTYKGDVMDDSTPAGGVDPDQRGRENK